MKEKEKMTWQDWLITILLFATILPAMYFLAENNEKKLFEVTIQNDKYNLYNQNGECLHMVSKDSLDKVLMYEYQIGVK